MSTPSPDNQGPSNRPPRRPPPAELERMLRSSDSQAAISREQRDHIAAALRTIRRDLEQRTCSSAWLTHCWESGDSYPPPAPTTPMAACSCERCQRAGRVWPAHFAAPVGGRQAPAGPGGSGFLSYECYVESLADDVSANLPSSPSGLALRAIREGRIKLRRQRTHTAARRFVS